jgi:hypothetical protein
MERLSYRTLDYRTIPVGEALGCNSSASSDTTRSVLDQVFSRGYWMLFWVGWLGPDTAYKEKGSRMRPNNGLHSGHSISLLVGIVRRDIVTTLYDGNVGLNYRKKPWIMSRFPSAMTLSAPNPAEPGLR